jgi:hypothetical protein
LRNPLTSPALTTCSNIIGNLEDSSSQVRFARQNNKKQIYNVI